MKSRCLGLLCVAFFLLASPSWAVLIGGVEFPDGATSFADAVFDFTPGVPAATDPNFTDPAEAIGVPDFNGGTHTGSVSLGRGGSITLLFTNNSLTGSGNGDLDLWIFEIGPDVEDTFVEISTNGALWHSVGSVGGATNGVDIDAFGWGTGDFFSYVRLTDDPNEGGATGATVGADIDAVGAISSAPPVIPEPATMLLLSLGLTGLAAVKRRRFRA